MIQLVLLFPFVASGLVCAGWREYRKRHYYRRKKVHLTDSAANRKLNTNVLVPTKDQKFDDMAELNHYQRISWYTLAIATSGALFYPPIMLLSIPLLSYNTWHFVKTIRESDPAYKKSPMAIVEVVGVAGTLLTGRPVVASMLMLVVFGMRNLLLQVGNIANSSNFLESYNPKLAKVWILRDKTEIEILLSDLQENDIIVLHPKDAIVLRGRVIEGTGTVRQYSLRGKMKSVVKRKGDKIFPFTSLESGRLHVKAVGRWN